MWAGGPRAGGRWIRAGWWVQAGWEGTGRLASVWPTHVMSCLGLGTKTKLQTTLTELGETQAKLLRQESALKELQERGEATSP